MNGKVNTGRYFEDFAVGRILEHRTSRTLTEGDPALYLALTGDRHPIYCDAEFARQPGFRRELVNDLLVFHIIFGQSIPDISLNAVATLGYAKVQFPRPVYAGDTLYAFAEDVEKKEIPGCAGGGALRLRLVGVKNQNPANGSQPFKIQDEADGSYRPKVVLDLDACALVPKRNPAL